MAKFLWTQRSDFGPSPRAGHAMTFDSKRGRTVLFGGVGAGGALFGDTWEWDGSFWTQMDNIGPAPRQNHAMVYDSTRQVSILFGGISAADLGDTWQWDGQDWTQVADSGPLARNSHAMAFDTGRDRTVLFGGLGPPRDGGFGSRLLDTWEFDGQNWTQQPATGPRAGGGHVMAFSSTGARVLLFDGFEVKTWAWSGNSWVKIAEFGPPSRDSTAMTAAANSIVLFGGGKPQTFFSDSWSFDGKHWTQVQNIGPVPRVSHALTFDSKRGAVVLFGGTGANAAPLGDTWEHTN